MFGQMLPGDIPEQAIPCCIMRPPLAWASGDTPYNSWRAMGPLAIAGQFTLTFPRTLTSVAADQFGSDGRRCGRLADGNITVRNAWSDTEEDGVSLIWH